MRKGGLQSHSNPPTKWAPEGRMRIGVNGRPPTYGENAMGEMYQGM